MRKIFFLAFVLIASSTSAQSFAAGAHLAVAQWSEFDGNDVGIGGRFTWKPLPLIGIEADLTWYPSGFPDAVANFSTSRLEGLFGVTVGPKINRVRPFARAAAGLLDVNASVAAFACIAIFPPPLTCVMAGGRRMTAYEIGGGIEIDATSRAFFRADIADRLLEYPGPSFRGPGLSRIEDDGFLGGALKFTIGAGFRF